MESSEVWKVCLDDPRYEVSDLGRIRRKLNKRIRKPSTAGQGYYSIVVSTKGKNIGHYIHRLVAKAFLGAIPKGMEVSHKNGNKKDNRASNLVLESHKDNVQRRYIHGTHYKGVNNPSAKLSKTDVELIRKQRSKGAALKVLATTFGVSMQQISRICLHQNWQ